MEEKNATFQYTYSAEQQGEIKSIRQKYVANEDDKMSQLRKLDESVTRPGTILGIVVGIIGTLVFGLGMTCVLEWKLIGIGCMIGIIGCVGIALAYPLYKIITKKQKEKLAPEIIRLTDELMR
ncbi:MAG: DUF1515 family protein [Cellulosilyticum sp.]|nr:DUF1515 family protein [Cellulosilyticum sp.]